MKKYIFGILIALVPIIIYLSFGSLFGGYHPIIIPFTLSLLFFFAIFLFRKNKKEYYLRLSLVLVIPVWLLFLLTSFSSGFTLTYIYIILIPLSVLLAWLHNYRKSLVIVAFSIVLFFVSGLIAFPNISVWQKNQGARVHKDFNGISLLDSNLKEVKLDSSKIIILDFWTTSCGQCFKQFPDLEKYYLEFKNNPNIKFYSVNIPLKRDKFDDVVNLVDKLNYKFPTVYASSMKEATNLGINTYPHLLIIKDGELRYDGILVVDKFILVNHLKDEVNRLLEE